MESAATLTARGLRDEDPPVRHRFPIEGLTIKAAMFLGFGLTFGLWIIAGYQFTRRIADVEREATAINRRYIRAQELLSTVRAQILIGSVYVRDAFLEPSPASADAYRRQLLETYRTIDEALQQYVPVLDSPAERERVARLRREIDDFRATMLEVLNTDDSRRPSDARLLLRRRIVPKRELVIRVSEEVQALNRETFVQQQAGFAEVYRVTQRRIWRQLGLALAGSLGIALLASLYSGRLENQLRHQRQRDAQNTRDLQRLSAKLITAQEEERRSIARELHDEVGQVLTAIKVELALAQNAVEAAGGPPRILEDARSIADGALQTVRDLSHLLHPAMLDDLGLPAAIDWHLQGFGKRHDIRVQLLHERMDERLMPQTEATAFRIVQEALTNVAKHAHAASCRVYLQRLPNTVLITIEDDGVGFDATEASESGPRRGLGLLGIRERVAQLRGTLRLESSPAKGTRLTVELPAQPRSKTDTADVVAAPAAIGGPASGEVLNG
jgi:signal transduction histidine kinase